MWSGYGSEMATLEEKIMARTCRRRGQVYTDAISGLKQIIDSARECSIPIARLRKAQ